MVTPESIKVTSCSMIGAMCKRVVVNMYCRNRDKHNVYLFSRNKKEVVPLSL